MNISWHDGCNRSAGYSAGDVSMRESPYWLNEQRGQLARTGRIAHGFKIVTMQDGIGRDDERVTLGSGWRYC